jgi:hypothetical protein
LPQVATFTQASSSQKQFGASDAGIKRLSYFIGSWNVEGFMKATQFGPAEKSLVLTDTNGRLIIQP